MRFYFYIGLLIIVASETLLFAGAKWVGIFFTPIVWTGYILFIDAIIFRIKAKSWIASRGKTFLFMVALSAVFWYIFEFFNLFMKNWCYEGLPSFWITVIGMTWAFATIGPGIFETTDLLESIGVFGFRTRNFVIPKGLLYISIIIGAGCLISILITPFHVARYLGSLLWLGFILLLDPINYMKGRRSILKILESGDTRKIYHLLIGGLICGFLWEFWNFWASARWIYCLPYSFGPKIFEMPLFGYFGFALLALDYYVLYSFVLGWRQGENFQHHQD